MTDDFLNKMVKDSEDAADALDDKGHLELIGDLGTLYHLAKRGTYHDFHRNGADAPKIALVTFLEKLKANTIKGLYDN